MTAQREDSLPGVFQALVRLLEQAQVPYLIVGGMAQAVVGEPRMTQDVDCIVFVQPPQVSGLLDGFSRAGFAVDRPGVLQRIESTGTFNVQRGRWRVDIILASTEFEQSALQRAQRLRLYDVGVNLPTPEDLIIVKLVPGREKDLLDAKTVVIRHRDRLDRAYLERWAQRLSEEAQDSRIGETLQRMLKETETT